MVIAMRLLAVAAFGLGVVIPAASVAQAAADEKQWGTAFFDALMQQGIPAAFRLLKEETVLGHQRGLALGSIEEAMNNAQRNYGTATNYELAHEARVGSTVVRLTYVVNYRVRPVQYQLFMYKTPRGWDLLRFVLDDTIEKLEYR